MYFGPTLCFNTSSGLTSTLIFFHNVKPTKDAFKPMQKKKKKKNMGRQGPAK